MDSDGEFRMCFPYFEELGMSGDASLFRIVRMGQRQGWDECAKRMEDRLREAETERDLALRAGNEVLFQMRSILASLGADGRGFERKYVLKCEAIAEKAAKDVLLTTRKPKGGCHAPILVMGEG